MLISQFSSLGISRKKMAAPADPLMLARVAAADVVQGELWGRDVKLEEQVGWRVMRLRMLGNTAVCAAG